MKPHIEELKATSATNLGLCGPYAVVEATETQQNHLFMFKSVHSCTDLFFFKLSAAVHSIKVTILSIEHGAL